ncbi:MAG TPA: hypothetical protein VI895_10185 [Bdellovibrionota bacterium]|nr:hypothetical protein [Bdellovibrionota bacterium]
MELRKFIPPAATAFFPSALREKMYGELWQKSQIDVAVRDHEDALAIKTHPLPYLELLFNVTNRLPVTMQIFGAHVEIWLGKPVVVFSTFISDSFRAGEKREGLRAYTFLNNFQSELLNPPKKSAPPSNVSIVLTVSCRSSLGLVEKTIRSSWLPPKILP